MVPAVIRNKRAALSSQTWLPSTCHTLPPPWWCPTLRGHGHSGDTPVTQVPISTTAGTVPHCNLRGTKSTGKTKGCVIAPSTGKQKLSDYQPAKLLRSKWNQTRKEFITSNAQAEEQSIKYHEQPRYHGNTERN